jgi:hypothetical protein
MIGGKISEGAEWFWNTLTWPFRQVWEWMIGDDGPASWPGKIADFFRGIGSSIWNFIKDVGETIKKPFVTAWDWLKTLPDKFFGFVSGIGDAIARAAKWVGAQALKIGIEIVRALLWIPAKVQSTIGKIPWLGKYLSGSELIDLEGIRDTLNRFEDQINAGRATTDNAASFDVGGVTRWAKNEGRMAILHGNEAVIPLRNGSVPVTLTTATGAAAMPVNKNKETAAKNINIGDITFVVRNDDDIETMKAYMLKLLQGQVEF